MEEKKAQSYRDLTDAHDVFRFVRDHLLAQGKRSYERTSCRYHGPEGTSCAVGCLIPDDEYTVAFENQLVESLPNRVYTSAKLAQFLTKYMPLLEELQCIHDHVSPEDWADHLTCLEERIFGPQA